jgi:hypothetical protein
MEFRKIGVIGKDRFYQRMSIEKEFGDILYDQLIAVLEVVGFEDSTVKGYTDIRIGVFLDTNNDGARYFMLDEKADNLICEHFGHRFNGRLKEYSLREQKKGTDLLYQLNKGELSIKDFENKI